MATRNIAPRANGEGSIGTSIKRWLEGWFGTVNATTVNTSSVVATGNVSAGTYTGNGSALTGIGSGTGGVINTGSTTIGADSDANGTGEIALQTRGVTRATVMNDGRFHIGPPLTNSDKTLNINGDIGFGRQEQAVSSFYVGKVDLAGNTCPAGMQCDTDINGNIDVQLKSNQWGIGTGTVVLKANGDVLLGTGNSNSNKVGIGTATPSYQLQLSTDSAAKPSTSTWTVASDKQLKKNIILADIDRCYEIVKALPLKRYTWRDEVYTPEQVADRSKLGWIAQDVEQVFPNAVGVHRFAYNQVYETIIEPVLDEHGTPVLDEAGNPKQTTRKQLISEDVIEDCRSLNSDQIIAALYGAVQKLQAKVEALEAAQNI